MRFDSVEKFTEYLKQPPPGEKPLEDSQMNIIVTGGTDNNYYSIGGLRYLQSGRIDKWQ
jgi:hypothetical protein